MPTIGLSLFVLYMQVSFSLIPRHWQRNSYPGTGKGKKATSVRNYRGDDLNLHEQLPFWHDLSWQYNYQEHMIWIFVSSYLADVTCHDNITSCLWLRSLYKDTATLTRLDRHLGESMEALTGNFYTSCWHSQPMVSSYLMSQPWDHYELTDCSTVPTISFALVVVVSRHCEDNRYLMSWWNAFQVTQKANVESHCWECHQKASIGVNMPATKRYQWNV